MTFIVYIVLVVMVCAVIGVSLLTQGRRKRANARIEHLQERARGVLETGGHEAQRAAVSDLLDAAEPMFFKGVRGSSFYFQIAFLLLFLAVGLVGLGWGMAGVEAEWQLRHATPCLRHPQPPCLTAVQGTIVDEDRSGHNNDLYVETVAGTQDLVMWGYIGGVHLGENVRIEKLGGTAVYVDTHEGRLEVDAYVSQAMYGLIVGLLFPAGAVVGLWFAVRQRATYAEWQEALEAFREGDGVSPGGPVHRADAKQ